MGVILLAFWLNSNYITKHLTRHSQLYPVKLNSNQSQSNESDNQMKLNSHKNNWNFAFTTQLNTLKG